MQARAEADELIRTAQEEAERLRASAFQEGYKQAGEEWERERAQIEALAQQLGIAYERFCLKQIPDMAELATVAAEKLLGEQLSSEPSRVITVVQQAMEQVLGATQIILHLNPEDVELVQSQLPASHQGTAQRQEPTVEIRADSDVERGGCWIESEQGRIDASVAGRLARLQAAIRDD